MAQALSVMDSHMLSLLTVLWSITPAWILLNNKNRLTAWRVGGLSFATFILLAGYGLWRLDAHPTIFGPHTIQLVQPAIAQSEKWKSDRFIDHFLTHIDLSKRHSTTAAADIIVWPETALNFYLAQDKGILNLIRQTLLGHSANSVLLTGMLRYDPTHETYQNALVEINSAGKITNSYAKHHLVPFGEYIPFQNWIPLKPVTQFQGFEFGTGPARMTSTDAGISYAPVICYEIIFSGAQIPDGQSKPDLIVNVTNDAWYGESAGPYQHRDHAIFRAIEEGIPVARAANTGISVLIDPYGRVIKNISLGEKGYFTEHIPLPLTFFSISVYLKTTIFLAVCLFFVLIGTILKYRELKF
jgi:apolipoprotein N-acyltransferase